MFEEQRDVSRQREPADEAQTTPARYAAPEAANAVGRFLPDGDGGLVPGARFHAYAHELFHRLQPSPFNKKPRRRGRGKWL